MTNTIIIKLTPQETLKLPLARFGILQGLVYALLHYDSSYSREIHNKKDEDGDDAIKLFSFSDLRGQRRCENMQLHYHGSALFEIRSPEERLIETVAARLAADNTVVINGCPCTVDAVRTGEAPLATESCTYLMNTPITVYHTPHNSRCFLSPDEEAFGTTVQNNLLKKYEMVYGKPYTGPLRFETAEVGKRDKCVTRYKGGYITAYYGTYRLTADEDMQRVAYLCGFGGKNSAGFGFPLAVC